LYFIKNYFPQLSIFFSLVKSFSLQLFLQSLSQFHSLTSNNIW
jgi:hypothetical protein